LNTSIRVIKYKLKIIEFGFHIFISCEL